LQGDGTLIAVDFEEIDTDGNFARVEGAEVGAFGKRRKRDNVLRQKKIQQALKAGNGRLVCEVPRCGFDFYKRYGELGKEFAHVHHLEQLSRRRDEGLTSVDELAIVCANCHAMIHRCGKCRELKGLIP
jgi:predicted HNH restriction endonuclease